METCGLSSIETPDGHRCDTKPKALCQLLLWSLTLARALAKQEFLLVYAGKTLEPEH